MMRQTFRKVQTFVSMVAAVVGRFLPFGRARGSGDDIVSFQNQLSGVWNPRTRTRTNGRRGGATNVVPRKLAKGWRRRRWARVAARNRRLNAEYREMLYAHEGRLARAVRRG